MIDRNRWVSEKTQTATSSSTTTTALRIRKSSRQVKKTGLRRSGRHQRMTKFIEHHPLRWWRRKRWKKNRLGSALKVVPVHSRFLIPPMDPVMPRAMMLAVADVVNLILVTNLDGFLHCSVHIHTVWSTLSLHASSRSCLGLKCKMNSWLHILLTSASVLSSERAMTELAEPAPIMVILKGAFRFSGESTVY